MERLITGFLFLLIGGFLSAAAGQISSFAVPLGVASIVFNLVAIYNFIVFLKNPDEA